MYFERELRKQLTAWKRSARKPLIIKGIRQVGKTTLVKKWGDEKFKDVVYLNLQDSKIKEVFTEFYEPEIVIEKITGLADRQIDRNETLIILDNIDDCISCIKYLPIFNQLKEKYYIISISCYFDFLASEFHTSFHKQVLVKTLHPLSFKEYISQISQFGKAAYTHYINQDYIKCVKQKFYDLMGQYYQAYLISGGLPESASSYHVTKSTYKTEQIKSKIRCKIQADFLNMHNGVMPKRLNDIWTSISNSAKFKSFNFSSIGKHSRVREYNYCIDFLAKSGLIHKINGVHFNSYVFADVGLYNHIMERANLICKDKKVLYTIVEVARNCDTINYSDGTFRCTYRGQDYRVVCIPKRIKTIKQNDKCHPLRICIGNYNSSVQTGEIRLPPFFAGDLFKFYSIAEKHLRHGEHKPKKVYDFY